MPFTIQKSKRYLTHPFAIAALLFIILLPLLPDPPGKYKTELIETKKGVTDRYYYDLDDDGVSEEISVYTKDFTVFRNGRVLDVNSFTGVLAEQEYIRFGDINNDNQDEIILFTHKDGFILCHAYNPFIRKYIFKEKKLCEYYLQDGIADYLISFCGILDANHDNYNELYLSVLTNDPAHPRPMISYDFRNDTVYCSPSNGKSIFFSTYDDIDRDGTPEFFCSTFSEKSTSDNEMFEKQQVLLIVLTPQMQYKFPPVSLGSYFSYLNSAPLLVNDTGRIAIIHLDRRIDSKDSYFALFDKDGKMVYKRDVVYDDTWLSARFFVLRDRNHLVLLKSNGELFELDEKMEIKKQLEIENINAGIPPQYLDIDYDGEIEQILIDKNYNQLIITRADFSNPLYTGNLFDKNISSNFKASVQLEPDKKPVLYIQSRTDGYYLSYTINWIYRLKYLIYACLYIMLIMLVWTIGWIQKDHSNRKYKAEKKIAELQLKAIKSRIDPHFTLNLLNSIAALTHARSTEKSDLILNKYIVLLRDTILSSDQISVTLKAELEFVQNYLELERIRFEDKFNYEFDIDENINLNVEIPKMLFQIFIENALKHGIKPLKEKGLITLTAKPEKKAYLFNITDHGVGREFAKEHAHESTNNGLLILDEILMHYKTVHNITIEYQILDLKNSPESKSGTQVLIKIPVHSTYLT